MTVQLVATVIACCILPSSVLGVDYPFNIFLSPKQYPCQGCDVKLIYQYAYNNSLGPQRENQIIWTFGGNTLLVVKRSGTALVIDSLTNPRIQWAGLSDQSDPGTITITDVQRTDAGDYQCQVFFFSGDNVKGTVSVDASNLLATCRITPASSQCGDSTAPASITTTAPTYTAGCNPQINWLDNSTGSMQDLNTTIQNAEVTTGPCPDNCSSLLSVPSCHSASTVTYQARWKVGSQVDNTPLLLCTVNQSLCPTTTAPTTIVPSTIRSTIVVGDSTTSGGETPGPDGPTTTSIHASPSTCPHLSGDCVLSSEVDTGCMSGLCNLSNCAQLTVVTVCPNSVGGVCKLTSMCNVTPTCDMTFNCTNTLEGCTLTFNSSFSIRCPAPCSNVAIIVPCVVVGIVLIVGGIIIYCVVIKGKKERRSINDAKATADSGLNKLS